MLDGWRCETCGSWIGNYQVHYCYPRTYPQPNIVTTPNTFYEPKEHCQHCYCQEEKIKGKDHLVCCMCSHRKLDNKEVKK